MHSIKVLLFANLRTKAGMTEIRIDIEDQATITDLLACLLVKLPMLRPHITEKIVISIDHKIADRTDIVPKGAEIAILPPVGGG